MAMSVIFSSAAARLVRVLPIPRPMPSEREFNLDAVRTDGWFERIGEGIGSFQALCEIVGEAFFAFSMITGARITALTVDRRNPDNTIVDFVVGAPSDDEPSDPPLSNSTIRKDNRPRNCWSPRHSTKPR